MSSEQVLCIPRMALIGKPSINLSRKGYYIGNQLVGQLNDLSPVYVSRDECETDPSLKQIIPYILVTSMLPSGQEELTLRYRRTKTSGEDRLMGKYSIGIGGHIVATDVDQPLIEDANYPRELAGADRAFVGACYRELHEELDVSECGAMSWHFRGIINDDTDPVGQVHLGILVVLDLERPCAYRKDPDLAEVCFDSQSIRDANRNNELSQFESWSRIVLSAPAL